MIRWSLAEEMSSGDPAEGSPSQQNADMGEDITSGRLQGPWAVATQMKQNLTWIVHNNQVGFSQPQAAD